MGVVVHVPHASNIIPTDVRSRILLDDDALARELLASTDHHTDLLVADLDADVPVLAHGVSRLVVDPERFLEPAREATEAIGRGAVYTRGVHGELLRDDTAPDWAEVRADLIARFFVPHHQRVEETVGRIVRSHGSCTLIDVHSYPSVALPYELAGGLDPAAPRPELCIGTDADHTPEELTLGVERVAHRLGIGTARDTPFAGTFVPSAWLGDPRVRSVMLEVRRDTYMDECTGALHDGAVRIRQLIAGVVDDVLTEATRRTDDDLTHG